MTVAAISCTEPQLVHALCWSKWLKVLLLSTGASVTFQHEDELTKGRRLHGLVGRTPRPAEREHHGTSWNTT